MPKPLRIMLSVLLGIVVGSCVNMGLILLGSQLIPPPAGADVSTMEGLAAALPLFEPRHFLFPFLAHALGTLAAAFVAARLAGASAIGSAFAVGAFFLLGGAANALMLPGPLWFSALDLLAYLPMAWLGLRLAGGTSATPKPST